MANLRFGQPMMLRGADGTVYWLGAAIITDSYDVLSAEASALTAAGEAVRMDTPNTTTSLSRVPRWDYASSGSDLAEGQLASLRVSAASNIAWIGVAAAPIAAGKIGPVLAAGSICSVKCLSSLTSNTLGNCVIGSSTAGSVDAVVQGSKTVAGSQLGLVVQLAGTAVGQTGTATQLGIVIAQG